MKLLNIDWVEMLEFLYLWEDLGRDDKDYFLFSMEPGAVAADSIPVDTADSLESCGLVLISASGNKLSFTNPARQYHRIFHALFDLRGESENVVDTPLGDIIAYLKLFYSRAEREGKTRLRRNDRWEETDLAIQTGGTAWPAGFLRCRSFSEWEQGLPLKGCSDNPEIALLEETFACAKKILRLIITHPDHWLPFCYIPLLVPDYDDETVIEAFTLLLENMLIFVEFSIVDLSLYVAIPGEIYRFINTTYFKPQELLSHSCNTVPIPPFRLYDTLELLTEAAREPLPITKSTGSIYAQKEKEITNRLISLPDLMPFRQCYNPYERLRDAMIEARISKLGDMVSKKDKRFFTITEQGKQWLESSLVEKLTTILEKHAPPCFDLKRDCFNRDVWGEGISVMFSLEAVRKINFSHFIETDLSGSLYHTLQNLAGLENPVTLESFLGYQSEQNNALTVLFHAGAPLLNKTESDSVCKKYVIEESEMVAVWRKQLEDFLRETAVPLGLLNTGYVKVEKETVPVIELSNIGMFFTGKTTEIELTETTPEPVVVQADFMIQFTENNPAAEVALSRFTERTGFSTGCLLKITAPGIHRAVGNGVSTFEMLSILSVYSSGLVPDNVSEAIEDWASQCRWITADTRVVVTCPHEETTSRIVKLAGKKVQQLSPLVFSVSNRKVLKNLMKLLGEKGIFLDNE